MAGPFDIYENAYQAHGEPYYGTQDATAAVPATPAAAPPEKGIWQTLLDFLGHISGAGKQGGGAPPAAGALAQSYVPPTGKGGGVDVVELAKMAFGGMGAGAGAMGGMGGMGAAGAAGGVEGAGAASGASGSGMGQAMDIMGKVQGMGGGGRGGGKGTFGDITPTAQPMTFMPLPYQRDASAPPGPMFGENIIPSTLDVWRPRMQNNLMPMMQA